MPKACSTAFSILLSFFSSTFGFILWSASSAKSTILQLLFFLLTIIKSGLRAEIRWSVCMSKSHRSLCVSFSRTCAGLCIYHLLVWSNLNFLHISKWITLPTQSCLVLYSFYANLLHSVNMWLIVSSLTPHSLHLLFCWVLLLVSSLLLLLSNDSFRVFPSALADGLSLGSKWQQVSSGLENSFQYSSRS